MNHTLLAPVTFIALAFSCSTLAIAYEPAPPPPGINDKGVETATQPAVDPVETLKPDMPDTRLVRDKASRSKNPSTAEIEASSDSVIERKEGTDTVTEYREKGKLRMVRVAPQNGPAQIYYDRNSDGRLDRDPTDGPVSPVYFTLYEWD